MKFARALAVMLAVFAFAGCQFEADMGIRVVNDTTATVMVKTIDSNGQLTLDGTLVPGATMWVGQSGCSVNVELRAFSTDGQEIQAKDGLCSDDTWHITATPTTPPTTTATTTATTT
ncbi:MAG: hypothetical protein ABIP19_08035 [Dermatophilaceae bacterium]